MAVASRSGKLEDLLEELKARSGLSYEAIGRKVHTSKSTVHRYCTGLSVPQEFGAVERIALACGASRSELLRLHDLWARAIGDPQDVPPAPAGSPRPVEAQPVARWRRVVALASVCLVVVLLSADLPRTSGPPDAQRPGRAWTLPSQPVLGTLFGVTINSSAGAGPAFRAGAARLWDSGTRWSDVQPRRGEFDWSVLDRLVAGAERNGLPLLFVFGGTPRWAGGSSSAPPDDLADWDAYVTAVVQRYIGRISSYELWALGNDKRFFSGDSATLVNMTRRAAAILRATDPKATVVCPGMGQLWTQDGVAAFKQFADLGGYTHCNVASVQLDQQHADDPPETMLDPASTADRVLREAGVRPRLWNTGSTSAIPPQAALDETTAVNHAVRFFLAGLYARNVNLERMYFTDRGDGGNPARAAVAVGQLQKWLAYAWSESCGRGSAVGLPTNVWECRLTVREPDRTYDTRICWTDTGTATTRAEPRVVAVHRLDGSTVPARSGDKITVTGSPVLIEYARR